MTIVHTHSNILTKDQICPKPECFQVSEIHLSGLNAAETEPTGNPNTKGPITFGILYKRNISTLSAALILKRLLGRKIMYGGLKDARSISWQFISFEGTSPTIYYKNLCFTPLTKRFTHISTKEVWGNAFTIHLKDLEDRGKIIEEFLRLTKDPLPAFYGPQRFGRESKDTHKIGQYILKKDYDKAVQLILQGKKGWYERILEDALHGTKTSEQALKRLPSELIKLFINAYQAHVFNRALLKFNPKTANGKVLWVPTQPNGLPLTNKIQVAQTIPEKTYEHFYPMGLLPGTKLEKMDDEFSRIEVEVLSRDGLSPKDFIETPVGEFVGSPRQLYFWVGNPSYICGKNSLWLKFRLHRGMYASVVLSFLCDSLLHEYLEP